MELKLCISVVGPAQPPAVQESGMKEGKILSWTFRQPVPKGQTESETGGIQPGVAHNFFSFQIFSSKWTCARPVTDRLMLSVEISQLSPPPELWPRTGQPPPHALTSANQAAKASMFVNGPASPSSVSRWPGRPDLFLDLLDPSGRKSTETLISAVAAQWDFSPSEERNNQRSWQTRNCET